MRVGVECVEVGAVEAGGDVRTVIAEQTAQIDDEYGFRLRATVSRPTYGSGWPGEPAVLQLGRRRRGRCP